MRLLISVIILGEFVISCGSYNKRMISLSDDIFNCPMSASDYNSFRLYIQPVNWYKELKFSTKNDTIFLLEYPGIEGDYYFSFWNKKDTLSYFEDNGRYKFAHNKMIFTKYMMKLVSEWNILEIREEEKNHSTLLLGYIYATRIIIKNGKHKIDCIHFKDFFDLKRDGMDLVIW